MNKKFFVDKKYLKISLYAFVVLALLIILEKATGNVGSFFSTAGAIKNSILSVVSPFLWGLFFAFFLNPIVRFLENKIFLKTAYFQKRKKFSRNISIIITFAAVIGFISWIIIYFVPELFDSINNFVVNLNKNISSLQTFYRNFFDQIEAIDSADALKVLNAIYNYFIGRTADIPQITAVLLDRTIYTITIAIQIFVGIFIAFYMLSEKEHFAQRAKKITVVLFGSKRADGVIKDAGRIRNIFETFVIGKSLDSTIIGIICFIAMTLLDLPYKGIISVIVGVTNMIPYFGPFIGYIPSTLIMLLSDPTKAGITLLTLIIIQIFDGNYLGPKILGASVGISPVWIIFSIVVGGAVAGPIGMFLGVPIFASIRLFIVEFIDKKYDSISQNTEIENSQNNEI